tara:strand:+ start:306 stop:1727 length:1422 start_codon:yes stop_codon:yes gene_type:complete
MVKLIRLKSDTDKLYFNNNIQSDLVLKPNSKIALQNVSFKKSDDTITIDSTNNKINFINDSFTSTIFLDIGTYNDIDIDDLMTDIKRKLNSSLGLNEWNLGKSFDASISSKNFVTINTSTSEAQIPANSTKFIKTGVSVNPESQLRKSAASDGTPDAYIGNNENIFFEGHDGCGIFRVQISTLAATGAGFYIGLSNTAPKDMGLTASLDKMKYAIYAENTTAPYKFIRNGGALTTSSQSIENATAGNVDNDYIEIGSYDGKIHLTVYNDTNQDGVDLDTASGYSGNALFPYIVFFDQTGVLVGQTYYIGDFPIPSTSNLNIIQPSLLGSSNIINQNTANRDLQLDFDSLDLALQLGFADDFEAVNAFNINWKAIRTVRYVDETECYLVEALNLQFNSYDGAKNQEKRRNLLAVIQNSRDRTAKDVLYDSNSPVYIDVNNINPLPLRNLQFRIINSDEGDVGALGNSNMTLLLE